MKSVKAISVLSILLVISIVITGCASNTTVTAPASTVTVTSTATGTTAAPQTVTVTAPAASVSPTQTAPPVTTTVTVAPSSSPAPTAVPLFQEKNNAHFFFTRVVVSYTRTPQPDGTIKETPIYEDVYDDLVLGGFKTNQDAIYVPPIPTVTTHGDWFIKIQLPSVPSYKAPWTLNWGYSTVSPDTKVDVSLNVVKTDAFYGNYYNNPKSIAIDKVGTLIPLSHDISNTGEISYKFNEVTTYYVILVRASDPKAVTGWWVKYGGKF